MDPDKLMDQWRIGLRISHRAHLEAAKFYHGLHLTFGIPSLVISAAFGTAVFAQIRQANLEWVKYAVAVLTILMIVFNSLQTFFRYGERSERHKTASVEIGTVRRKLEQELAFGGGKISSAAAQEIREAWDSADTQAPTIPNFIYNRVQERIEGEE